MYFLSLFVIKFLRHWQLYQLRLNPAGIESHMLRQGHAKVSPCDAGGESETRNSKNSARSMVLQTLETPIGCLASQSLGGNAWREGSWISLEIKRPMTHQLLKATDVGKSAGCRLSQAPRKHIFMQISTSYWKTWEETMGETWISFGTRGAESQIQVCCRRVVAQLAKNAENSPSAHHISLQSLSEL